MIKGIKILSVAAALMCFTVAHGQSKSGQTVDKVEADWDEHELASEISTPEIPDKVSRAVKNYMRQQAESLNRLGYDVKSTRNGEVLIVTIPTDKLFAPNDTTLQAVYAQKLLEPFTAYFKTPGRYKLVLAVYTDDTGKPAYTSQLATDRARSVYGWFCRNAQDIESLRYFGEGEIDPLVPNISRKNRATNRRLEIFIVPDQEMLKNIRLKK